nr:multidrug resistance-associated protein 4-like isoform X2 [Leptinotarsa decemlineata]
MVNSAVKTWWRMDHCEKLKRKINPRETANICSLLTFSYVVSLFKKSFKHDLEEEDLYEVLSRCGSKRCGDKIEDKWRDEIKNNSEASLAKIVWKRFGWRYMRICTINICWKIFRTYNEVIRVCALQVDFNLLEKSDDTIVIDGGLNLSKGQRTRINLARAVYKNSDIYLLDDSLTDLDGRVQDYIFKECIRTYLKGKICVLVSQAPNHINEADTVIMVNEGRIKYSGKPTRIILQEVEKIVFEKEIGEEVVADYDESEENERLIDKEETKNNRMYKEVKEEGKVNIRVYHKYLIFGGGFIVLIINLALGGLAQTSESYSDKLLTRW